MAKKNFYAVKKGRRPGIYSSWDECKKQVDGFPCAVYQGFVTREEAEDFMAGGSPKKQNGTRKEAGETQLSHDSGRQETTAGQQNSVPEHYLSEYSVPKYFVPEYFMPELMQKDERAPKTQLPDIAESFETTQYSVSPLGYVHPLFFAENTQGQKSVEDSLTEEPRMIAYTAGSLLPGTNTYSYGVVAQYQGKELHYAGYGNDTDIPAEAIAVRKAVDVALRKGVKTLFVGVGSSEIFNWLDGESTQVQASYRKALAEAKKCGLHIWFLHIPAYPVNRYKEQANKLARSVLK